MINLKERRALRHGASPAALLCALPTALSLTLLCAPAWTLAAPAQPVRVSEEVPDAPATPASVNALSTTARRDLAHDRAQEELTAIISTAGDDLLKQAAERQLATLALERAVLEKAGTLAELRAMKEGDRTTRLASTDKDGPAEVTLARWFLLTEQPAAAEAAIGRARDRSDELKSATDDLLAEVRGESVPRGGYFRYRGRFVPMARRDRERALDGALSELSRALPTFAASLPFTIKDDQANLAEFERTLGGAGKDTLFAAVDELRESLRDDYAEVRKWVPSYAAQPKLRDDLLRLFAEMATPRRDALALIARYDKPEQREVDAFRKDLEARYAEYDKLRKNDQNALAKVSADDAWDRLTRMRQGERALAAADQYLGKFAGRGIGPFPVTPSSNAVTKNRHQLPGREQSGLEDILWIVVHYVAGLDVEVMQRVDEFLRRKDEVHPWERLFAADLRNDAIERYNEHAATSLDKEERRFMLVLNRYRRVLGLAPFEIEERLNVSSRKHSREMVTLGYFGHVSPVVRNRTPTDRARLEGYGGGVGENCLGGKASGQGAFNGWYHSPGHHRNLVSGGPHLGVGAVGNHSMWTMVAGGTDLAWRFLHKERAPSLRREVDDLAERYAAAAAKSAAPTEARAAASARAAWIMAPLARLAFPASNDSGAPYRDAWVELARFLVEADVATSWRPLQVAAVAALIDGLEIEANADLRGAAWATLKPLLGRDFPYDPKASKKKRITAANQIRAHWEDLAQFQYRQGPRIPDGERVEIPRRPADGPSLEAPLRVLSKRDRLALARQHGGGNETEKAVDQGLKWLASVQDEDGGWRARSYATVSNRFKGHEKELGHGNAEWEVAMTGLSLLAFLSAGNSTEEGEHKETVARGVQFLLERIVDYGRFETTASHYMYNHAIGTQALCEAYAYSGDPHIGAGAQLALDYIAYAQHHGTGGWRYLANERGDTSVTGWVIMALNAGLKAKLDAVGFRGAKRFLNSVTWPAYYQVGYTHKNDGGTTRLGAVGMLCNLFIDARPDDPAVRMNSWRMLRDLPPNRDDGYYWYYGTLGMFQVGGEAWDTWNTAIKKTLLDRQVSRARSPFEGSWAPKGQWSNHGGRIYQTAISVLMLTTYYRYSREQPPRISIFTGDIDEHVHPFIEGLKNTADPVGRAVSARKLIDSFGDAAGGAILNAIGEPGANREFRRFAALLLPDCVSPRNQGALLKAIEKEKDDQVRESLVIALEFASNADTVAYLSAFLDHKHHLVRANAARILGRLGQSAATTALSKRLAIEKDGGSRRHIEAALTRLASTSALDVILTDAALPDRAPRVPIVDALELLERGGVTQRLLALKTEEPAIYREATALIREHQKNSVIPVLIALLKSRDVDTRSESIKLLKAVTYTDNGFRADADDQARERAVLKWGEWWKGLEKAIPGSR